MKILWGGLCGVAGTIAFLGGALVIGFALCSVCFVFVLAAWGGAETKASQKSAKPQVDE
jgi:hypothetical protein